MQNVEGSGGINLGVAPLNQKACELSLQFRGIGRGLIEAGLIRLGLNIPRLK
jgi:hypothetical protein